MAFLLKPSMVENPPFFIFQASEQDLAETILLAREVMISWSGHNADLLE
jgi:hypothetical protein